MMAATRSCFSVSGLRASNALDMIGSSNHNSFSVRKARARRRGIPRAMFERYTEKGIEVVMRAQEEARRLGHNYAGTEQILLGLIAQRTGIAAKALNSMGITLESARVEFQSIIGMGTGFVAVDIPFTPRAKRVLDHTLQESRQLGHNYIGPQHLLLGILCEGEGVAARVLENFGADPIHIRIQVLRMMSETGVGRVDGCISRQSEQNEELSDAIKTLATKLDTLSSEVDLLTTHINTSQTQSSNMESLVQGFIATQLKQNEELSGVANTPATKLDNLSDIVDVVIKHIKLLGRE